MSERESLGVGSGEMAVFMQGRKGGGDPKTHTLFAEQFRGQRERENVGERKKFEAGKNP